MTKRKWKSEKLPRVFTVRATDTEHEKLKELAEAANLSLSRLMIDTTLNGQPRNAEAIKQDQQTIKKAIFEVRKAGVNLNQITATLNSAIRGSGKLPALQEIEAAAAEVKKAISILTEKL
jgi:alpha-D-ribose 1-methylphosphonate 5-triphosphate synthase subunit PhnI